MAMSYLLPALAMVGMAQAHIAAFAKGMYCENGTDPAHPNFNSNAPVNPLFNLTLEELWFQRDRGCDKVPPPPGVFLDIPAGGSFTVDLANNQAFSRLSYGGSLTSDWPDGDDHPEDFNGGGVGEGCIQEAGYMHVQDQQHAQGSAFAISYESEINDVNLENLVVFTVLEHTPWKRIATYQVPKALPACPEGGCTCAWLWVPRGCGQPNIYMQGFKCKVSGATSTTPLAKAKAPTQCESDSSKCVQGAKQMIVWNQLTGNNVFPGEGQTPAYNLRNGFKPGAQDDIFAPASSVPAPASSSSSSPATVPTSTTAVISITATVPVVTRVQSLTTTTATTTTAVAITTATTTTAVAITTATTTTAVAITSTTISTSTSTSTTTGGDFTILPISDGSSSSSTTSSSVESVISTSLVPVPTTFSTTSKPESTTGAAVPAPVTVTVTVTAPAVPTYSGKHSKHFKECWVSYDEEE